MKVKIQATNLVLEEKEILEQIPKEKLEQIKKTDSSPLIQAFSIVQEGVSKPRIIGEGTKTILWSKRVVDSVSSVIKQGIQFFLGHNADNSTNNRKPLAEVVGSFKKEIKGVLNQIVLGYFPNKEDAKYDVCSIEAEVNTSNVGGYEIAESIDNITGIALGSSKVDTPAFAGAVKLGLLQAFDTVDDNTDDKTKIKNKKTEGDLVMTIDEIKKGIKELNVWPWQVFDLDTMKKDNEFGKHFTELEESKTKITDLEKKLTDGAEDLKKATRTNAVNSAKETLKGVLVDREKTTSEKLSPKQNDYINLYFKPENMDDVSSDAIEKFVTKSLGDFKEAASIFGVNSNDDKGGDNNSNDDKGDKETPVNKTIVDEVVDAALEG